MFPFLKKEEPDIHMRNIRNHFNSEKEQEEYIGVLIQFTPIATYLFINKQGYNSSSEQNGFVELQDLKGNLIEVFGNTLSLSINNMNELPDLIERYKLKSNSTPLVQIEVEYYTEDRENE